MAEINLLKISDIILFITLLFLSSVLHPIESEQFSKKLSKREMGLKREKLSHLHFYLHDIVSGKKPTAVRVAQAAMTNSSATGFGFVVMIDDPLTEGPNMSSKLVGRGQGIYASAAQNELGLLMVLNYVFAEGKYNGSTLSILGRITVSSTIREMPIVGGSGLFRLALLFRLAHDYARAKTHSFDHKTAVVEYNIYVFHY